MPTRKKRRRKKSRNSHNHAIVAFLWTGILGNLLRSYHTEAVTEHRGSD